MKRERLWDSREALRDVLDELGREAREMDVSPIAQAEIRAQVRTVLATQSPMPTLRLFWSGGLAKAAGFLVLLTGTVMVSLVLHAHRTEQGVRAEFRRVAALESRISLAQQNLAGEVRRFRARYADTIRSGGILAARSRRLSTRIAVCSEEIRNELRDAAVHEPDGDDGGLQNHEKNKETEYEDERDSHDNSVWRCRSDAVLADVVRSSGTRT